MLQQPLPFTVLKRIAIARHFQGFNKLQQPLPFTVLKLTSSPFLRAKASAVATALTVYGIETPKI